MAKIIITITDDEEKYLKDHYKVQSLDLTMSQIVGDVINRLVDQEYVVNKTSQQKIAELTSKIK
jgi:hypothetical protein